MQRPHQPTTFPATALAIVIGVLLATFVYHFVTPAGRIDCPVSVDGEDETYSSQLSFSANPGDYQSYSWQVSTGEISGPRDTPSITVVNVSSGSSCKATVTIRHNDCTNSASRTTKVRSPPACPTVSVSCPSSVDEGQSITFGTGIPVDPELSFNWSISAGEIKGGQGTPAINVDSAGLGGRTITATVQVGGFNCSNTASCTTEVIARKPRKTDQFAGIGWTEVQTRLQSYASQLQNEPAGAQGYVVVYGYRNSAVERRRVNRLRAHLMETLNVKSVRVVYRPKEADRPLTFELWIVPNGAPEPPLTDRP